MLLRKLASGMTLLALSIGAALAATPDQPDETLVTDAAASRFYTISGGELRMGFNTSLLDVYGASVEIAPPPPDAALGESQLTLFNVKRVDGIQFSAARGSLDRFVGGLLQVDAKFAIDFANGERLAFDGFTLRVDQSNPMRLQVVGADGRAWLYVNHLMYELVDGLERFHLQAADLRATPALAERVGVPELADAYIGALHMRVDVTVRGEGGMGVVDLSLGGPNFHGAPFAGGGIYEADVLMENYSMSFSRCRLSTGAGNCDGSGPDNGEVVFTPSSTLRNSGHPNTADVPWYAKFTGGTNPYGYPYPNADQHPYLIWNLYHIIDGQLEQIAASGLKHAWLTTNTGCSAPFGGHILSPNCGDTYGTFNNDDPDDLGPRSELIPATGYWGRCGSIHDTNCDGFANADNNGDYGSRLIVRESQLGIVGAQYYSDSWYVVQDDINIYNTMMHKTIAPTAGGSGWTPGSQGGGVLGPLINAWVDPVANPTQNVEIDDEEGHTRIAVKVKTLDECPVDSGLTGTCYRYDYAVNNFDFARAVLGDAPNDQPPNLRVVSNLGFNAFTLPTGSLTVYLEDDNFADIDIDDGNNWTGVSGEGGITWTAPEGNELNWGTLYRFSFVTNVAPDAEQTADVVLAVAGDGEPVTLTATMMVPQGDNDTIFKHDFELTP